MRPQVIPGPYLSDLLAQAETLAALRTGLVAEPPPATRSKAWRAGRARRALLVCAAKAHGAAVNSRLIADIVQAGGRAEQLARESSPGVFHLPPVPEPPLPLRANSA